MSRSTHPKYDAGERFERRFTAKGRRYRRHLQAAALRAEMAVR